MQIFLVIKCISVLVMGESTKRGYNLHDVQCSLRAQIAYKRRAILQATIHCLQPRYKRRSMMASPRLKFGHHLGLSGQTSLLQNHSVRPLIAFRARARGIHTPRKLIGATTRPELCMHASPQFLP